MYTCEPTPTSARTLTTGDGLNGHAKAIRLDYSNTSLTPAATNAITRIKDTLLFIQNVRPAPAHT